MGLGIRGGLVLRKLIALGAIALGAAGARQGVGSGDGIEDLLDRARAFEARPALYGEVYRLYGDAYAWLNRSGASWEREQVLDLSERLQAGLRASANEQNRQQALNQAAEVSYWFAVALEHDREFSEVLLQRGLAGARGTPVEPRYLSRLAHAMRLGGRTSIGERYLGEAQALLFAPGGDPFASPAEASRTLAEWFDARIKQLYMLGAYDASELYLREFERRCGGLANESRNDESWIVAFMLLENGLRVAIAADRPELARAAWTTAEEGGRLARIAAASPMDELTYLRTSAEAELERRGEPAIFDPEPHLVELVESETASPHVRCNAGLALVQLLLDRGEQATAREVLASLPSAEGDADLETALAAFALHFARLDGDPGALAAAESAARAAFERRVDEWSRMEARQASFLGLSIRSIPLRELLLAQVELAPHPDGGRRAFELVYRMHAALAGRAASDAEIAAALGRLARPGRLTLVYVPSSLGSLVVQVDDQGVRVHELAAYYLLTDLGRELESAALAVAERGPDGGQGASGQRWRELEQACRAAHEAFVPDVLRAGLARARELVIVGAEDFGWPRFELFGAETGAALGATCAIWHELSLPRMERLAQAWLDLGQEAQGAGARSALVVTAPSARNEQGLGALAFGERERELARRTADALGDGGTVLAGDDATLAALSGALARRGLLCLTAHGLYEPRRVDPAGIQLSSGDGVGAALFSEDIAALRAAPVAAVFVCRAGAGPTRRGSARAAHLGGAFLDAGALAVVLAPTELDYARSLELGASFAEGLGQGLGVAEALRRSRVELGSAPEGEPFDVHPYLVSAYGWAADPIVIGSTARPPNRWLVPMSGGLVVAAALGAWVLLRRRAG